MKRLGLVGGLGPESTIDYYRRIVAACARADDSVSPPIVIDSLDVATGLRLSATDRAGLIEYVGGSIDRLAAAGADFIAMAANTPHMVFDELAARSPVPLVSIVEACAEEAEARGIRRVALLGTRFTMEAPFYPEVFGRRGIEVVAPDSSERTMVHARYVEQLLAGEFLDSILDEIIALIRTMRERHQVDGVVLGGTELTILLPEKEIAGVPALDSTALHVGAIVRRMTT